MWNVRPKQTIWERISWRLFSEWRFVFTLGILGLVVWLMGFIVIATVIAHFIRKYW